MVALGRCRPTWTAPSRERRGCDPRHTHRRRPRLRRRRQGHRRGLALRDAGRSPRSCGSTGARRPRHNVVAARRPAPHLRPVRVGHPRTGVPHPPVPVHGGRPAGAGRRGRPPGRARRADPFDAAHRRRARRCSPRRGTGPPTGPGSWRRGADRHGSCGMGVGRDDGVRARPPRRRAARRRLPSPRPRCGASSPRCATALDRRARRAGRAAGRRRGRRRSPAFGRCGVHRGRSHTGTPAATPDRASSRARRACCSTSGAAGTRTRPGPPRPSPTRATLLAEAGSGDALRLGVRAHATPPGTAPARW